MCAADCPGTRFRQSPVFHFTLLDQCLHAFRHILNRHIRIGAMLIKKIDMVRFQTLQRALYGAADMVRMTVKGGWLPLLHAETELSGNHHTIANRGQCFPDKLFTEMGAIHLGSIKERDALFEGGPDERNHGFTIARTTAVIPHHRQTPESHA